MAPGNEGGEAFWQAAPPAPRQTTMAADLARLRALEQASEVATCQVLRALIAHYGGWEHVPRKRRGCFADYTAEQVSEYIAQVEREPTQG